MTFLNCGSAHYEYPRPSRPLHSHTAAESPGPWQPEAQADAAQPPLSLNELHNDHLERQTLDAQRTTRQALAGVDFGTRLDYSAVCGGPGFKRVISRLGITSEALELLPRERIDAEMRRQFERLSEAGHAPISAMSTEKYLIQTVILLTKRTP